MYMTSMTQADTDVIKDVAGRPVATSEGYRLAAMARRILELEARLDRLMTRIYGHDHH